MKHDPKVIWDTFTRSPVSAWRRLGVHFFVAGNSATIEFKNGQKVEFSGPPNTFAKWVRFDLDLLDAKVMADMAQDLAGQHYETGTPIFELEAGRQTSVWKKLQHIKDHLMNLEENAYLAPLPAGAEITAEIREPRAKGRWERVGYDDLIALLVLIRGVVDNDPAGAGITIEPAPVVKGSAVFLTLPPGHLFCIQSSNKNTFRQRADGTWHPITGRLRLQGHLLHV